MQRGVRFDTCPICTGAFHVGSEKRSKQFKINCLGCFGEAFFGGPIWTIEPAKTFPCSVALVFFFRRSAPMQRGAPFAIFDVPCGAPCWAQQGRQKSYRTSAFLMIFQMKGTLGAATKCIPKSKVCKISSENECFVRLPWELFGVHLGWSIFWCAQIGCSNGAPKSFKNKLKQLV